MPKTKERVSNAADSVKPYVERAVRDKELRDSLQNAYAAARDIYDELIAPRSRTATLVLTGIAIGVLFNPLTGSDTRRWLRDRMFGGSDDFDYSSPPNSSGN